MATAHVTPLLRTLPSPVSHSQGPHRGPLTLTTDLSFSYPRPAAPWPSSLPTLPHAFLQVSAQMPSYQRPSLSTLHKRAPAPSTLNPHPCSNKCSTEAETLSAHCSGPTWRTQGGASECPWSAPMALSPDRSRLGAFPPMLISHRFPMSPPG